MKPHLILDTHALVWFLQKDGRLAAKARKAILSATHLKVIPFICLCEIQYLHNKGKFELSLEDLMKLLEQTQDFIVTAHGEAQVPFLLPQLDIHDALIVAAACEFQYLKKFKTAVISKDGQITAESPVPVLWA